MYANKPKLHERERNHVKGNLKSIHLDVTNKCNMKCKFCYAETFVNKEMISLDVLKKVADEAYEMGVTHYCLTGGEVCADYERLKEILKIIHPDETYINIISNGWGMTKERILELRDLQVDKIAFSLDSGIEEEHDENRMKGSYKRVLEAIDNVLEAGLLCGISTVVTHQSLYSEGFKKAYDIAKEKGIRLEVQIAEPVGKWDANTECLITKEDAEYIWKLREEGPTMANGEKMVRRDIYHWDGNYCRAGKDIMSISSDGNFMPCNYIQASLGNVKDRSLREMREDLLQSKWFNQEYNCCILGECEEFIEDVVMKYKDVEKPLNAYEVFGLERKNEN